MTGIVLIETYWNVNFVNDVEEELEAVVLIETYWNVNKLSVKWYAKGGMY